MKKLLFFTVAACFGLTANAQNKLTVNGLQERAQLSKTTVDVSTSPVKRGSSSSKVAVASVAMGAGPNAYGPAFGPRENVWADEDLNTIVFIHRSDFGVNGDNGSGSLRYDMSTDGGKTFNSNFGPIWNTTSAVGSSPGPARYPLVTLYNPTGNTTPNNAYLAFQAPTLNGSNGSWGGLLQGSVKAGGTTDLTTSVDSSGGDDWYVVPSAFTAYKDRTFGINLSNDLGSAYRDSLVVLKGVWNTSNKDYDYTKQYIKVVFGNDANGDPVWADARIAFAPNIGTIGYISILGYMANYSTYGLFHPIVLKTTNGGATWSAPANVELDNLIETASGDSLIKIFRTAADTNFTIGNLSTAFDHALTVDKNGNPHIITNINPASISLNGGGGNEFSIISGLNAIVDIYSTDGGTNWKSLIMGSPQSFRGDLGGISEDNRPYASRSADGSKIFAHWFDTDLLLWGSAGNEFPDAWMNGYDVDGDSLMTPNALDITGPDINSAGSATFGCVAPQAFAMTNGQYQAHIVIQQLDQTTNDVADPTKYFYYPAVYPQNNISVRENNRRDAFELGQNFPNPANDYTRFNMNVVISGDYTVEVLNMLGQVVIYKDLGKLQTGVNSVELNISNLTSGVYFYTVKTNGASVSKKMIIE